MALDAALTACKLIDNPFDPERDPDPDNAFDFRENATSLTEVLEVFRFKQLERYYFRKCGLFQKVEEAINDFLDTRGGTIDVKSPPTLLIAGKDRVGMTSAAQYVAHRFRLRSRRMPKMRTLATPDDDFTLFLRLTLAAVQVHANESNIAGIQGVLQPFMELLPQTPQPQQAGIYINALLGVRERMLQSPWLILLIDEITDERKNWIAQAQGAFAAARIAPFYLTKELSVKTYFEKLIAGGTDGFLIKMGELDVPSATEFVGTRLKMFRGGLVEPSALFPFAENLVEKLVASANEGVPIGFLIQRLGDAINVKLAHLRRLIEAEVSSENALITWDELNRRFGNNLIEGGRKK